MPFERSVGAVVFRRSRTFSQKTKGGSKVRDKEKKKIYYLVLKRKPVIKPQKGKIMLPDYWDLPKGHPEKGEKKIEAARREIHEETGISKVKHISGFSTWTNFFYRAKGEEKKNRKKKKIGLNVLKVVDYYIFETKENKIKLSREHIGYKWLEYGAAYELLTYKKTKKVLNKADKFLTDKQ
jgi:bis(5'-nucleosidyl)-tetraphosphatase